MNDPSKSCVKAKAIEKERGTHTLYIEHNPFADGRRNTIGSYAQVGANVKSRDSWKMENFSIVSISCPAKRKETPIIQRLALSLSLYTIKAG